MKKVVGITAGVVVVAVAGWLGSTWYTGKRIQSEEPVRLAQLNKELAQALATTGFGATISQISYDRHFFSSDVRYGVKLTKVPDEEDLPEGMLEVVGKVEHGPFPKGALARGDWMPKLAFIHSEIASNELLKPVFEVTKGVSPLVADTIVSYNGDTSGTAAIAPMAFTKDGQSINFAGSTFEGSFVRATKHIVGKIKADAFSMNVADEEEQVQASITGIHMDLDSRDGQFGIGVGNSTLKVDNIAIDVRSTYVADAAVAAESAESPESSSDAPESTQPDAAAEVSSTFNIKDLSYTAQVSESGSNLAVEVTYNIGKFEANGSDFGKGNATIKFDQIDGKSAKALSQKYEDIISQMANEDASAQPSDGQMIEVANLLIQLLASNPRLRIDPFVWETTQGQSTVTLAVDLTKPEGLVVGKEFPSEIDKLAAQAIKLIDLKVVVDKPMVQGVMAQYLQQDGIEAAEAEQEAAGQVESMAGLAEMFGIAKSEGEKLVGTFIYADNKATLNGEEIPADELFSSLLSGLGDDDYGQDDSDNELLTSLDPSTIGDMLESQGYAYELDYSDGAPVLNIDPSETGAESIKIYFNDCYDTSACTDIMMSATVDSARTIPMGVFNEWNQANRLTRAYWNAEKKTAVMESDLNAYGGIGKNNVDYSVLMFMANIPSFAQTMTEARRD